MEQTKTPKGKEKLIDEYNNMDSDTRRILENSYETVVDTKASENRLEELKVFCKKMEFKKIGIAFCKGLRLFGKFLDKELSKDFEVVSVCCNAEGITKDQIGVKYLKTGEEPACNPLGQASVINNAKVDIVVKCGFCIGHDIIFTKNIDAPETTFIVKDRRWKHKTAEILENDS